MIPAGVTIPDAFYSSTRHAVNGLLGMSFHKSMCRKKQKPMATIDPTPGFLAR